MLDRLVCSLWEPFVGVSFGMNALQLGEDRTVDGCPRKGHNVDVGDDSCTNGDKGLKMSSCIWKYGFI